jgi:hypothetical protein
MPIQDQCAVMVVLLLPSTVVEAVLSGLFEPLATVCPDGVTAASGGHQYRAGLEGALLR